MSSRPVYQIKYANTNVHGLNLRYKGLISRKQHFMRDLSPIMFIYITAKKYGFGKIVSQ